MEEIDAARHREDFNAVKKLTQQLIEVQRRQPSRRPIDRDVLVRKYGIQRHHLEAEQALVKQLESAQDPQQQQELRVKLIAIQKEMPQTGVKLG